jgi:hypothetical protein
MFRLEFRNGPHTVARCTIDFRRSTTVPLIVFDDELACSPGRLVHVLHEGGLHFSLTRPPRRGIVCFEVEVEVPALIHEVDKTMSPGVHSQERPFDDPVLFKPGFPQAEAYGKCGPGRPGSLQSMSHKLKTSIQSISLSQFVSFNRTR